MIKMGELKRCENEYESNEMEGNDNDQSNE